MVQHDQQVAQPATMKNHQELSGIASLRRSQITPSSSSSGRYLIQLWRLKNVVCFGGKGNFPLQLERLFLNGHCKRGCKQCCLFPCKEIIEYFFER
ncbi:hypothetical protein AALO_G00177340 [Alosa alosa]|uniref:Uncharacterized protein n=1 Tax=Alosa alosa TaxID=278164 RepID=A0AAV6G7X4_9TELE|nr:hypothetical protein AALO_G00177340 [Alosa alosa]